MTSASEAPRGRIREMLLEHYRLVDGPYPVLERL